MIDWDDYRLILHLARRGRVQDAAADLGVTASTVFRRLASIEEELGAPVFRRTNGRYIPTEDGAGIALAGERMEQEAAQVMRRLSGGDQSLSGTVTIAASEVLACFFVARHVREIGQRHPDLKLFLLGGDRTLDLSRHEADLAIRPHRPRSGALFGRKLQTIRWARYTAAGSDEPAGACGGRLIGYAGDPQMGPALGAAAVDPEDRDGPQYFANSLILRAALCVQTGEAAMLPMVLGEMWPGLRRLGGPTESPTGEMWIVCHNDLRRNARVRAVFDALIEAARSDRRLFEGDSAQGPPR